MVVRIKFSALDIAESRSLNTIRLFCRSVVKSVLLKSVDIFLGTEQNITLHSCLDANEMNDKNISTAAKSMNDTKPKSNNITEGIGA
jgi:hypothetical protein